MKFIYPCIPKQKLLNFRESFIPITQGYLYIQFYSQEIQHGTWKHHPCKRKKNIFQTANFWLVGGFNPFENISQFGSFPQVEVNIKNIWNHHLEIYTSQCFGSFALNYFPLILVEDPILNFPTGRLHFLNSLPKTHRNLKNIPNQKTSPNFSWPQPLPLPPQFELVPTPISISTKSRPKYSADAQGARGTLAFL